MGAVAYQLRDEYAGDVEVNGETVPRFTGGPVSVDVDREINIGEALGENDGVIVVDDGDHAMTAALDGYPALKRVAVPEGAEPVEGDYDSRTNNQLRAELNRRGVQGAGNKSHDELVAALEGYDTLNEAGTLPVELTVKTIDEATAGAADNGEGGE